MSDTQDDPNPVFRNPKSTDDPYQELALIEHALAAALALPRWVVGDIPDEQREALLGASFVQLRNCLADADLAIRRVRNRRNFDEGDATPSFLDNYFMLQVDSWAGTASHTNTRERLIAELWSLRAYLIESLRVIPIPENVESMISAVAGTPQARDSDARRWQELTKTEQRFLQEIRVQQLTAKELAPLLCIVEGSVRKVASRLGREGFIASTPANGYWLKQTPRGAPAPFAANSG